MRRGGRLEAGRLFCVLMLIEQAAGHGYGASAWTGRWFDGRIQPGMFSQRKPDTVSLVTPVNSCGLPRRLRAGALRDLLLVPTPRAMITTVPNFSISGGHTQGTDNLQDAVPGFEQFEQVSGLARPLHDQVDRAALGIGAFDGWCNEFRVNDLEHRHPAGAHCDCGEGMANGLCYGSRARACKIPGGRLAGRFPPVRPGWF